MHHRQPLLIVGHFFLTLAFLFMSIVDNTHAVKMFGGAAADLQNTDASTLAVTNLTSLTPCHEAMMVSTESVLPDPVSPADGDDRQPCCPYDECSPDNCLMHMAMTSIFLFEMLPHSDLDERMFPLTNIYPVPMPFTERLRPPIA